ncbi:hypothetical protein PP175_28305 (plasmid) [Aneurinibacillus sp. Ricciae_BoGa-3]|uniref:hypothetical protein n=1 Tax=Aneurinibacillus sp. Ricciae_BoGa-3 TaxID=3022697 RepID=UPI002341A1B1|nr:hypothetical protein [Aneurinibacillus sp. Ricciae_BoGa-3]WCK57094.1 hypothetical protein PP175_28305 [Aneurinibacillus sp. Ricciae_BoGa-3]
MNQIDELIKITEQIRNLTEEQFESLVEQLLKLSPTISNEKEFRNTMRRWYTGYRAKP